MALRKTGLQFVHKGLPSFMAAIRTANKSVGSFTDRIDRMRTTSFGPGGRSPLANLFPPNLLSQVQSLVPAFSSLVSSTGTLSRSMVGVNSIWSNLNTQVNRVSQSTGGFVNIWQAANQQAQQSTGILTTNQSLWATLNQQMQGNIQTTLGVNSVWSQLNTTLGGAASKLSLLKVSLSAALVSFSAFAAGWLSGRGAGMRGIVEAFDLLSRYAETTAETLRTDLRQASRGTIRDMDLMKTANLALAGTEKEVAKALGQGGLAGLLEIARAQARATGRSVNYLYESLVLGVRRTSPRLVDNTGLIIGQTAAYEAYAKKVGKAANELSEVEKQLAILELTLERGKVAVDTYGKSALTAAERMQRIDVQIANALDRLALAVQPLFETFLAMTEDVLRPFTAALEGIAPVVYELAKAIGEPLMRAWQRFTDMLSDTFAPVMRLVRRWIIVAILWVRSFGIAWDWLLRQVDKILGKFPTILKAYIIGPLAAVLDPVTLAHGAGKAFGALAIGILHAFNYQIAPAILLIAKFIADFLCGTSPPPKGPLHDIDKGGYRTMLAWLEGFLGVSLTPVEKMAARIDATLGSIGRLTHEQVEARLARLDELLEPFIANLDIARAYMERITEPLRAVQDILERKLDRALAKFFKGEWTAEAVRAIDRQMEGIEERVARAQEITDDAEVQLELAKSQQAVMRALLEIQLRRTKAAEKEKEAKEKAAKAGKEEEEIGETGVELPELGEGAVGEFLGISEEEIKKLAADMGIAFVEGFDAKRFGEQMGLAESQIAAMQFQFTRIKEAAPFGRFSDEISTVFGAGGIITTVQFFAQEFNKIFDTELTGAVSGFSLTPLLTTFQAFALPDGTLYSLPLVWHNAFKGLLSSNIRQVLLDFTLEPLLTTWANAFGLNIGELWIKAHLWYEDVYNMFNFSLPGIFTAFSLASIITTFQDAFGLPAGSLWHFPYIWYSAIHALFTVNLAKMLTDFSLDDLITTFTAAFALGEYGALWALAHAWYEDVFNMFNFSLPAMFTAFSLANIILTFTEAFAAPGMGIVLILSDFIQRITDIFKPGGTFAGIFTPLASILAAVFSSPIAEAMNIVIGIIEWTLNNIIRQVNALTGYWFIEAAAHLGIPMPEHIDEVTLPRLPTAKGRTGGLFGTGWMQLHRDEVIYSGARKLGVFPPGLSRQMTTFFESMNRYQMQPASRYVPVSSRGGNDYSRRYDQSQTAYNFNVRSNQGMRLVLAQTKAFR